MKLLLLSCLLCLCFLATGCEQAESNLPVISMKIGSSTFKIEVAATPESQETGLMRRDSMPSDHGMIFVFPDEQIRSFWMKNTRIPLDIVFLDSYGIVVSIRQMAPYDLTQTSSNSPARYAIELNKGAAESAGLKVGDRVAIPAGLQSKPR